MPHILHQALIDFLKILKEKLADKPIAIVLDNARNQHCFLAKNFAKSLSTHLLFLPTYFPNLTIIERLWKFTKKKILLTLKFQLLIDNNSLIYPL
jgi:transposase